MSRKKPPRVEVADNLTRLMEMRARERRCFTRLVRAQNAYAKMRKRLERFEKKLQEGG